MRLAAFGALNTSTKARNGGVFFVWGGGIGKNGELPLVLAVLVFETAGLEYGIVAACERFYLGFDSARSSAILKAFLSGCFEFLLTRFFFFDTFDYCK